MTKLLSVTLALSALVSAPTSSFSQSGRYSPADLDRLKSDIQAILKEAGIPGASIALVTADEVIWAGGLGKADVAGGVDVTDSTLFRVGSISKSFTALAILTLVEQGRLPQFANWCQTWPTTTRGPTPIRSPWHTCWSIPPDSTISTSSRSARTTPISPWSRASPSTRIHESVGGRPEPTCHTRTRDRRSPHWHWSGLPGRNSRPMPGPRCSNRSACSTAPSGFPRIRISSPRDTRPTERPRPATITFCCDRQARSIPRRST
ncbi:MAG: hypothetical protein FJ206_16575 [Gemmatimonadetes bacterium]|nr:hypothetical protein [Gemmatimonadota bacterium]